MSKIVKGKPSGGISFLGFLLTFIMIICLISGGLLVSVKTTILSGSDINEVLENSDIYGMVSDIVVSEIDSATDGQGFSKEAVEKVFTEEVLKSAARTMTDAIKNDKEVDLSGVKDECMGIVKDVSIEAVDDIVDEIKEKYDVISLDVLKNSDVVKKIEKDYNVDITTVISDYVEDTYGSTTINVSDIDMEKVRTEAKKSLDDKIIPTIEKTVDEYIVDVNVSVNKQIKETNEEFNISGAINTVEVALNIINIWMILTIAVSVFFAVIQIAVLYKNYINRGIRNIAIAAFISGIVVLFTGIIINVVRSLFTDTIGSSKDNVEKMLLNYITNVIDSVASRTILVGVVYLIVAVICTILVVIIKKRMSSGDGTIDIGTAYNINLVK